jgi:arylsulfatase
MPQTKKPNILVLWGDDIGWWNISFNSRGQMGYRTPSIDRLRNEGVSFTNDYGQQSCTAGRAAFITGDSHGTHQGRHARRENRSTGGGSHHRRAAEAAWVRHRPVRQEPPGRSRRVPHHGFDEFFGNLYHLNAEEEPELPDYPKGPEFKKAFGPRGVLRCTADGKGDRRSRTPARSR